MAGVFDEILVKGVKAGQIPAREQKARDWYRNTAKGYTRIDTNNFLKEDGDRMKTAIDPGSMYMFWYNPKHKDTLPFYDRFPLIFPFRVARGAFWGINFHYLPLNHRAILMDALYDLRTNSKYNESTRLRMSYEVLNSASKFKFFKPCIKQYLTSHMASKFMYIYPSEWDMALFTPTEQFEKATKTQVWKHSKEMTRG